MTPESMSSLPLVFAVLMGVAVLLYVVLDGYDLGVGMLMPATTSDEQDVMVASIGVYSRDILLALPFVLQIWMFVSPIMYPLSVVPEAWRTVYCLNPMVGVLEGFRAILLDGAMPDLQMLAVSTLGAGLIFVLGWSMFKVFSQYFADVL